MVKNCGTVIDVETKSVFYWYRKNLSILKLSAERIFPYACSYAQCLLCFCLPLSVYLYIGPGGRANERGIWRRMQITTPLIAAAHLPFPLTQHLTFSPFLTAFCPRQWRTWRIMLHLLLCIRYAAPLGAPLTGPALCLFVYCLLMHLFVFAD